MCVPYLLPKDVASMCVETPLHIVSDCGAHAPSRRTLIRRLPSGFDGGDCCECTCVSTEQYTCGENGGFSCLDPSAPCADDDDVTTLPSSEKSCLEGFVGDGDCDPSNNFEECGGGLFV